MYRLDTKISWLTKIQKSIEIKLRLQKYQLKFLKNKSIIWTSRVYQVKLRKELFRFSFSCIRWILLCAPRFLLIHAYLHSVSNWSYRSGTNPSMACVAGAWKGRERGFLGAPSRFFRAQNLLSLPFQTPVTQANLSILAYFDEGVAVCLCMGGGRQTVFIL